MPSRVRLLDPNTINRIAAGEVVERPASVVKELVENSLDAGASSVVVEIEEVGKKLIRVTDDGTGMSEEDATLAMQRHATSKLADAEGLLTIRTMGFRGEALPSIASVSKFTLTTRPADSDAAVRIRVEDGQMQPARSVAAPVGTCAEVEDLFFNTPARLKFLRSDATELSQIVELVARYAIIYPEVTFLLRQDGQDLIRSPGGTGLLKGIAAIWSREVAESLVPVEFERHEIRVSGFISPPHITRHSGAYQHFFVNRRPVRSRTITAALTESFRSLTPERRYPIAVLGLELDPARVDCNVHPSKSEIKFQKESEAFEAIRGAVRAALIQEGMMPEALAGAPAFRPQSAFHPSQSQVQAAVEMQTPVQPTLDEMPVERSRFPFSHLLDGLRVVGQAMNTFIIAETRSGIAIIDQHVAHERVIYERLCGIKGRVDVERQALLQPETIHLDRRPALVLEERMADLNAVGFDVEPFGGGAFLLRGVPAVLSGKDYVAALKDVADELAEPGVTPTSAREKVWITTSCRMAVKAGDPLTHAEMLKLLHDLADTENPYLCPHGRPITITLSTDELLRKFKRI